jgi:poly(3-hydroxyoctanoate) depolymerase
VRQTEGHLRVGGSRVFVREVGEGAPVVLLNGIGAHVEMWRPLERALPGVRLVSFDAPGTGRSSTRTRPYTMGWLAALVEQLFDALELDRADVIGYSFGGALAQQFAHRAPERIRRLVLAATSPGWGGVPGRLEALMAIGTPLRYHSRFVYERTAGALAGGRARVDPEHVRRLWHDRAGYVPSSTGYAHQLWAGMSWSSLPWLHRVEVPTLIVVGDDDPLVPVGNALLMAARMPQARVFVGRGEGHYQLLDEHSSALQAIGEFLAADPLETAPIWSDAPQVDRARAAAQLRSDGLGALPWGAVSAAVRRLYG